ncbi:MAG TPA: lysylphosphatidylglycerol synthase transmembrane domain-containing protein [Planctomycetota bacterium]|nr:lysylphosphatidylglycerol synthase transmembrane domain-containing protein [Planctomycetota bacterium]
MAKRIVFAVLLILGLGGFLAVPVIVGVSQTLEAIGTAGVLCIVAYVLNASIVLVVPGISWWILMRTSDMKVSLADALRANFMGFPVNFITPSAYLGGEPVKALYISNKYGIPASRVLGTLIIGKFQEVVGLVLLMVVSAAGVIFYSDIVSKRDEVAMLVALGVIGALFLAFILAYSTNFKPIARFLSLFAVGKTPKRRLANLIHSAEVMEQTIRDAFIKRWKSFLASGAVALLSAVSILMRLPLFIWFTPGSHHLEPSHVFLIYFATNLVNIFQIIPGNLGVLDGTILLVFSQTGLEAQDAAAYAVVGRIADAVLLVFGAWLLAHYGLSRYMRPKETQELKRVQTQAFVVGADGVRRPREKAEDENRKAEERESGG